MKKEIKNIFHYAKLEKTFNSGYSFDLSDNQALCDVQDCYGMSNETDIIDYWNSLKGENQLRQCLVHIISRSQDHNAFCNFLKLTVLRQKFNEYKDSLSGFYDARAKEINKEQDKLQNRIDTFQESKKPIFKRIRKLMNQIRNLEYRLEMVERENKAYRQENIRLGREITEYGEGMKIINLIRNVQAR